MPGKSLPCYTLQPRIGQADPYLLGYVVRSAVVVKSCIPPVFPWTLAVDANFTTSLYLGRVKLESATLALPAGVYADAPAVAAAVQAAFAGSGTAYLSATTVSNDVLGRLICTPAPGATLQITGVTSADKLALGFTASQGLNTVAGDLQAQNSCNLINPTTYTANADKRLVWVPEDLSCNVAAPPLIAADNSSSFYWGWSLAHAASIWTTAYAQTFPDLTAAILLQNPAFTGFVSAAPTLSFNATNSLFSVSADSWSVQSTAGPAVSTGGLYPLAEEVFTFSMDEPSDVLFGCWNEYTPSGAIGSASYATLDFSTSSIDGVSNKVVLVQDSSSLSTGWSPVTSILATSNDIPVVGEQVSAPAILGNIPQQTGVASTWGPVLAEISFLGQPATIWTQEGLYEPTVVRRVQMQGDSPLTTISVQLSWRDRFGSVRPIELPGAGGIFTVKLQFLPMIGRMAS